MIQNDACETIQLDGNWQFRLGDEGSWTDVMVPGCWESKGFSMFIDGPAYYRREIVIPESWEGKVIWLEFGAVSYACSIYCNEIPVGSHQGLWTPFTADITGVVLAGETNKIELVVWKPGERYPMRSSLAGFLPDLATTFGGLWQSVSLCAGSCRLHDVSITTDVSSRSILVRALPEMPDSRLAPIFFQLEIFLDRNCIAVEKWAAENHQAFTAEVTLAEVYGWSPDHPILYSTRLTLFNGEQMLAQVNRKVGFRSLAASGPNLIFNSDPFMVRGILSWGWEPDRVAPYYTAEQAREEIRKVREMGFNLIKLCLVIPNQAYFDAADEEGMLVWVELPMWLPKVTAGLKKHAPVEYADLARMLAHHPSIVLYSLGCELNRSVDIPFLSQLNSIVRSGVRDVLICDNSGSGESYGGLDVDFSDFTDYHPYYDIHYFEPLLDHWKRDWQPPRPWIFGEFCDSDTFRDFSEIIEANGGERPWWATKDNPVTTWRSEAIAMLEWEQRLERAQPGFSRQEIVEISYRQSFAIRKYTLESVRKRRGIGGYIITGLRDTPISTSGIWDDLGRPKWDSGAFQEINGESVLALDVPRRRQWRHGGDRPDRIDLYCKWGGELVFWAVILHTTGKGFLSGSQLNWRVLDANNNALASFDGASSHAVEPGIPVQVGSIQLQLPDVLQAEEFTIEASVTNQEVSARNHWKLWVFPKLKEIEEATALLDPTGQLADLGDWLARVPKVTSGRLSGVKLLISTVLDEQVWQYIEAGGRVLLLQLGAAPLPVRRCPFWREAVKLFPQHPVWQKYPQQRFTDLQFFGIAGDFAFDTSRLKHTLPEGTTIQPVLRRLDAREFHMSEYLFEARIGDGVLFGCALRLGGGAGTQPAGWNRNVAGAAMLQTLLDYLMPANTNLS